MARRFDGSGEREGRLTARRAGNERGTARTVPRGCDGGRSAGELIEVFLGVERGHAAGSGRSTGLAIDVILHVAGGEDAGDAGLRRIAVAATLRDEVAVLHFELADEEVGVRLVADGDEHAVDGDVGGAAVGRALQARASDALGIAQDFVEHAVPGQCDLPRGSLLEEFVLHDLLAAQLVAAVDQGDVAGDVGQVEGFFDRSVAAADHGDRLVAVEEPVAGRAARDAFTHEGFFGRQSEVLRRGAGGDDQRIAGVGAGVADQREGLVAQLGGMDVVENDLGFETPGVCFEALHQLGALNAVGISRPVVDLGGGHQLAALREAGDQHRLEVGTGGVDRGGVAGGAGAQDEQAAVARGRGHFDSLQ